MSSAAERAALSPRLTFRGNLGTTRHGWLRLTPAYSVELVRELVVQRSRADLPVLGPFCGTGTTLTACAELGIACRTVDEAMARAANSDGALAWVPPLRNIEQWWDEATLGALSRAFTELAGKRGKARDLAALAFCCTLVDAGNVSFRHQSLWHGFWRAVGERTTWSVTRSSSTSWCRPRSCSPSCSCATVS